MYMEQLSFVDVSTDKILIVHVPLHYRFLLLKLTSISVLLEECLLGKGTYKYILLSTISEVQRNLGP